VAAFGSNEALDRALDLAAKQQRQQVQPAPQQGPAYEPLTKEKLMAAMPDLGPDVDEGLKEGLTSFINNQADQIIGLQEDFQKRIGAMEEERQNEKVQAIFSRARTALDNQDAKWVEILGDAKKAPLTYAQKKNRGLAQTEFVELYDRDRAAGRNTTEEALMNKAVKIAHVDKTEAVARKAVETKVKQRRTQALHKPGRQEKATPDREQVARRNLRERMLKAGMPVDAMSGDDSDMDGFLDD